MGEWRRDPLTEQWVVIAPERAQRPGAFRASDERKLSVEDDPFVVGKEEATPQELYSVRGHEGGWSVRVVPNKFPALGGDPASNGQVVEPPREFFQSLPAAGAHEVIIEGPFPETRFARLPPDVIRDTLRTYQQRLLHHQREGQVKSAVVFKNEGELAGASVGHCHSQLMALPNVPPSLTAKLAGAAKYWETYASCYFDDLRDGERLAADRIVLETSDYTVLCPFASRFAYEMAVIPRRPGSHFERAEQVTIDALALVLRKALLGLEQATLGADYNLVLQSAPLSEESRYDFRWHLEILPRMSGVAGFELGYGCFVNPVSPERAAKQLRDALA